MKTTPSRKYVPAVWILQVLEALQDEIRHDSNTDRACERISQIREKIYKEALSVNEVNEVNTLVETHIGE